MPRLPRVVLPGQPHHLIQRGNNRSPIFFHPNDYHFFLDCLLDASQRYSCQIYAYVLMTNHIHLLVSPETETALASLMQSVGQRYVQYVNRRCQRTGTLWEGRYRAVLIDDAPYVLTCYRDIELNPVRAQMVSDPAAYPWSSYGHNAHGQSNPLLHAHALYQALGPDTSRPCQAYEPSLHRNLMKNAYRRYARRQIRVGCWAESGLRPM
jgi:putative transposase